MEIIPTIVFFVGIFLVGIGMMVLSSQYACRKQDLKVAASQSAIFAGGLSAVHLALPWTDFLRQPLQRLCNSYGLLEPYDMMLANTYVLILASWPLSVWTSLATQQAACVPTPDERAQFKQELQAHLKKLNGTAPVKPAVKA